MMDENELVAYALLESIINEEDKETYDDKMEELVMRLNEDEWLEGVTKNQIEWLMEAWGATTDNIIK